MQVKNIIFAMQRQVCQTPKTGNDSEIVILAELLVSEVKQAMYFPYRSDVSWCNIALFDHMNFFTYFIRRPVY
jgi:hypothetical protein